MSEPFDMRNEPTKELLPSESALRSADSEVPRPESLDGALELLDQAIENEAAVDLKQKRSEELQALKSNLRANVRSAIEDIKPKVNKAVSDVKHGTAKVYGQVSETVLENAAVLDRSARANPWPYIGGIAVGAFTLGLFLGHSFDSQTSNARL